MSIAYFPQLDHVPVIGFLAAKQTGLLERQAQTSRIHLQDSDILIDIGVNLQVIILIVMQITG